VTEPVGGGRIDWLASYPKSGNTWMRMLLANYFSESDAPHDINAPGITRGVAGSRWLFDSFLGIASSDLLPGEIRSLQPHLYATVARRNTAPIWLKVHDQHVKTPAGDYLFPAEASGVAIYIVRNPLDVAVSNAFHDGHRDMTRAVNKLCDPTMTIAGRSTLQLPQQIGDWSTHVTSWVDQTQIPVLAIRYEDMLADTPGVLERVLAFARPMLVPDQVRIESAVRHSHIEMLQAAETANGFRETPPGATRFFRRGQAGDWRNHLSPAQVEQILTRHLVAMQRFGYA